MALTVESLLRELDLPLPNDIGWLTAVVNEVFDDDHPGAATSLSPGHVRVRFTESASGLISSARSSGASDYRELFVVNNELAAGTSLQPINNRYLIIRIPSDLLRTKYIEATAVLHRDQTAEARRVLDDVRRLTRVAAGGDASQIVSDLAELIRGWAVVVDREGNILAAAGAGKVHQREAIALALGKPIKLRDANAQRHAIGLGRKSAGSLVVSGRTRSISRVRALAEHAASLLNLTLHVHDHSRSEQQLRQLLTDEVLRPNNEAKADLLRSFGFHSDHIVAFRMTLEDSTVDLEGLVSRWLQQLGSPLLFKRSDHTVAGFISSGNVDVLLELTSEFDTLVSTRLIAGISNAHRFANATAAWAEAALAYEVASQPGSHSQLVRFHELTKTAVLYEVRNSAAAHQSEAVLDPLAPLDPPEELRTALFHFLNSNGALGEAATAAGVHRHTLRTQLATIQRQTGLDMASMVDRVIAWTALLNHPDSIRFPLTNSL